MSRSKVEKRAVGTLLIQQGKASAALRSEFKARTREKPDPAAAMRLVPALTAVIYDRRQAARSAARRRLSAELTALHVEVKAASWVIEARESYDFERAQTAARSLAEQWRQVASLTEEDEEARSASVLMRARLERTARTEIAQAYSEEHREALRDIVRNDREFRDGELAALIDATVRRVWSALADACPRCFPLDGEEVGVDESYPGGEVPGWVHPHCQCCEYLVKVA